MTTMILEPPPSKTRLGVGFDSNRRPSSDPQAWKKNIGTKPIPARLAMLPEGESRMKRVGISAAVQIGLVVFILLLPLVFPQQMKTALNFSYVELAQPITTIPVAPPPPPPKIVKVDTPPRPKAVIEPVLNPKQQHIFVAPKMTQPQPKVQSVDAKAPDMTPVFEAAKVDTAQSNQPKRPRDEVKVGTMSTGNATPATVKAPVEKVQTGGFGDPNGLPGKGNPNAHLIVNAQGLNTLPNGPGYGNGTGGDKGIRGTVASTGFGSGTANPPPGGGGKRGTVQSGGFSDATVAAEAPKKKTGEEGPADTAVVILDKPRPEYTAEGRSMRLEGDVVLDVVFQTTGRVQVNRVVSGLGHGLDESASRAAQQIKFKPALREGQPVNYPARVRIEFRLAY
jgi:TonB family protein